MLRKSKFFKFLASIKLAVIVIMLMTILIAWGTIVESIYQDAEAAKRQVYQAWYMYAVFAVFALNLSSVMVDRWPWKRRHLSFLLAHIGIIVLLIGSVVTFLWGIDGSLRVAIQDKSRFVFIPDTQLTVWSSFDGDRFTKLYEREVDFYRDPPQKTPIQIPTDKGNIELLHWYPYAVGSLKVERSPLPNSGAGIQFTIRNPMVDVTEWILQTRQGRVATHDLGPARIHLGPDAGPSEPARNEIYLEPMNASDNERPSQATFKYSLYRADKKVPEKGQFRVGEGFNTGWMGLELKVLQYIPKADQVTDYTIMDYKTEATSSVLKMSFDGREHWLGQNDVLKLFTESSVYYVSFAQKRIDLGFDLYLKEFRMDHYPGTNRAATYQSLVTTPEGEDVWISMNEPLKYQGFTFYQASFQQGADGAPVASILSVNRDPGRFLKYLGSLILSIGVIILFYDRRKAAKAQMAPRDESKV